jgi:hypothetical protein
LRFTKAGKENYREMGLLSFSVVVYTSKNGQQTIDMYVLVPSPVCSVLILNLSHENISDLLGIPCKSFTEMYEDRVSEIMRTFHEYIATVKASGRAGAGAGAGAGQGKRTIQLNSEGYPIAPSITSREKLSKSDLENLYRSYITFQYRTFIKFPR